MVAGEERDGLFPNLNEAWTNQGLMLYVLEIYLNVEKDSKIELFPKMSFMRALQKAQGRVSVSVCNTMDSPIMGMLLGQVSPATPISYVSAECFYPANTSIPSEWKNRLQVQLLRGQELPSENDFDEGFADSTQNRIWKI